MQNHSENINSEFIAKSAVDYAPNDSDSRNNQKVQGNAASSDFILNELTSNVSNAEEENNFCDVNEKSSNQDLEERGSCKSEKDTDSTKNVDEKSSVRSDVIPEGSNDKSTTLENEENDEWMDILGSGQLKRKIVKRAENTFRPQSSFICEINLEGQLEDGTIVDKFEHRKIQVGDAELIQGLDLTLPLMDVGEECLVEVAPRFAYGTQGRAPDIPPNSKITYRIELLSAEPEPELETIPIAERKRIGNEKRERGNWWYARQDYTFAIQCYRRALEFLDDVEGGISHLPKEEDQRLSDELQNLFEDRLKVYNNLAAAQMKIKAYDTALQSVENVLHCQPKNVKALFRKGKILAAKGDNASAVAVLRSASQLEPDNKIIKQELLRLVSLRNEDSKNERNLYKKMLGQEKSTASSTKGSSKSYQIRWGIVFGSVAAVVAGMVAYRYKFL
ncbi:FK506-binding protein 59 [Gryllus bimaculatus]|nr:FK506-binding protein 59 [Gryllus bimaculatus]